MAARESDAMKKARKLIIKDGLTAYAAAKQAGISRNAIYMSNWYKLWKGGQK